MIKANIHANIAIYMYIYATITMDNFNKLMMM